MLLKKSLMSPARRPALRFCDCCTLGLRILFGRDFHLAQATTLAATPVTLGDARSWHVQRRLPDVICKGLKVLHDGSQVELVACTGKAPQAHTFETVVGLQVGKAHLDLLSLITGFGELRRPYQGASRVASVLMHVARDPSKGHVRGALGLERT